MKRLAASGTREVTLLGQIVNLYGRTEFPRVDGKSPFVQLLEAVHEVDGIGLEVVAAHFHGSPFTEKPDPALPVHEVNFDASNLSSGVYFYRFESKQFVAMKKMLLLK